MSARTRHAPRRRCRAKRTAIDDQSPGRGCQPAQLDRYRRVERAIRLLLLGLAWLPLFGHRAAAAEAEAAGTEAALIELDWRKQDGIDTERKPSTYRAACEQLLQRGDALLSDLEASGTAPAQEAAQWQALRRRWDKLSRSTADDPSRWSELWKQLHRVRRQIALSNPLFRQATPLVFAKQKTASFSHQLTQYLGRFARPGGGIFVLIAPGGSFQCRQLAAGALPEGSYLHPEVSPDGRRVLFAYCQVDKTPASWNEHGDHFYHIYEVAADGSDLRQLTDGPYNDFSPKYLPNGQIIFVSTRRGGWHRCGGQPGEGCENHTLAVMNADGSQPRTVSFHETQEWDPAVLDDGRVIFTRWDYVDRHAVHYEQLFTVRPDGSGPVSFYGNNTLNPVGIWEARPVPGSRRVMAIAGPHHAMTAGSVILVDGNRAVDGPAALSRLTPDALFPESETAVPPAGWHAPAGVTTTPAVLPEAERWPGHCYKSPYPLAEKYFLAAYSFDTLIGEPQANPVNMFGLYLVDCFGNKELLYRDPEISSIWPVPLRSRELPKAINAPNVRATEVEGRFFVQNVYESYPPLPAGSAHRLRVVQLLPKSTPGANWPRVGVANASPGKQVLGTVPVEADGSAYFRAPAGIPLSFQVVDEKGQAVQIMRSVTYLQPGEVQSCVGCHEHRTTASPPNPAALALLRPPSSIQPGPDGSNPLSYPILVQPVLDRHCVGCHTSEKPAGSIALTGDPQGAFSVSYNALAPRVSYSDWGGRAGDFRVVNSEPVSQPGYFGARGSSLMRLILEGHHQVELSAAEIERLATWMDANALFYGTFNHEDQVRQQRGERIAGPALQ